MFQDRHWSDLGRNLVTWLGVGGLALWAFSAGIDRSGIRIGSALMTVTLLIQWRDLWPRIRKDPVFWTGLVLLLYLIADAWWAVRLFPATVVAQRHSVGDLAVFSALPALPIAWWMGGNGRRIGWVLVLMLAGLTVGVLIDFNWSDPASYLHGARLIAARSPNGLGLYSATAVLGLAIFGTLYILTDKKERSPASRFSLAVAWIVAALTYTVVLVLAQSRSAWLAAAIVIVPIVTLFIYRVARLRVRNSTVSWRPLVITLVGIVIVGSVAIYASFGAIEKRIVGATEELAVESPESTADISDIAVRTRLELWKFGLARFGEHPLLGFGPGTARHLISTESAPIIQRYRHFHNLYLHLLVTVGIVGAVLVAVVGMLVLRAAWIAVRAGSMPVEFAYFVGGAALLYLLVSFFTIRHDDTYGRTYLLLLSAIAYSFWLHRDVARQPVDVKVTPASVPGN